MPKPAPMKFCGQGETQNCQPFTPGNQGGAVRGHGVDNHNKPFYNLYKPPEELWPEDFPPAPKVCGSPFTGKLITR